MRVELDGGEVIDLGTTETAPTIGITDYSRRVTDDFGVTTVVKRGFARRMSVRMALPFSSVDALQRRLADLRATPALWVANDNLDSLAVRGFYKDFSLDVATRPLSFCTLTVEGLTEGGDFTDPGTDPATDGRASTLRLLQPLVVTDGLLTASNVAEADYPEWAAGTNYALGARVILAAQHRAYESAAAANVGNDPIGVSGKWIDVGPTNRWAMFDQALGSLTSAAGSIIVTLDPAEAVNAVALLDVTAATVRVQTAGYDRTIEPASQPGMALFLDMPATAGAVVITVTGVGTVSVGTCLLGSLAGLGTTEASPTAGITDFSRKETDDFGDVTVVERAWAKRMSAGALIRTDAVDVVAGRIAAVRARPSLWIGDEGSEAITLYGFFKDFSIEVGENVSRLSLSIEGLSAAAKLLPTIFAITPRGNYDAAATYDVGNVVVWTVGAGGDGNSYIRIGSDSTTGIAPSNGTKWALFVEAGIDGTDGTDGTPGAPGTDGVDGVDGIDGKLIEFVWQRAASVPAAPSGNGIPAGWSDDPPVGIDPLWMSKAKQELDGTLVAGESWSTPIRHDGPPGIPGSDGAPGTPGADGVTLYTWIAYADSADGTVNFTTGSPGTRSFIGIAPNQATAVEGDSAGAYAWSRYSGPPGFGLVASSGIVLSGAKIIRTDTSYGWNQQVYSSESFTGGAYVSFKPLRSEFMVGLNTDPTTNDSYNTIDYALYCADDGGANTLLIYKNGVGISAVGNWAIGDTLAVHYNGGAVYYYRNGSVIHSHAADAAGQTLFLDSSFVYDGEQCTIIAFAAAGAVGPQGAPGTDGAPGTPGADGTTLYTWIAYADSSDGTVNFTTGSPGSRTFIGLAANQTTASEGGDPASYVWSQYSGPPSFGLVASSGMLLSGNKIIRTAAYTGTWSEQVYSSESFTGGAYVSFKPLGGGVMVGLNTDPTSGDWNTLDYALYPEGGGAHLYAAESGSLIDLGGWSDGDTLAVHYDGAQVRYYRNGSVLRTASATAGQTLFLDSAIADAPRDVATIIAFAAAGAAGTDGTNGLDGAPGPPGLPGSNGIDGANGEPALGFVQDADPGPGAFYSQTWYRPTSRQWFRWNGTDWVRILGDLSVQDLIADAAYIGTGVIISAHIGTLQVKSANIENLTVGTSKIADFATSAPMSAFTPGAMDVNNIEQVIQTVVVEATGNPIFLFFGYTPYFVGPDYVWYADIRIRRDGDEIHKISQDCALSYNGNSGAWLDTPPAGFHTYTLTVTTQTSNSVSQVSNRYIFGMATKGK